MNTPAAPGPAALEQRLGLRFHDPKLLEKAITHRSFVNEMPTGASDNERLEYLGDALVDFIAADLLYRELPEAPEGELTSLRSHLVRESTLAAFARELDLPAYLRLGRGEAAGGGREREGLQCDAFEALIGAIYLDQGFAAAEALVMSFFRQVMPDVLALQRKKDAKSRLQELTQRLWQLTPTYHTLAETGPDHLKHFVVAARVGDDTWGTGEGASKTLAAQVAAEEAIAAIQAHVGA